MKGPNRRIHYTDHQPRGYQNLGLNLLGRTCPIFTFCSNIYAILSATSGSDICVTLTALTEVTKYCLMKKEKKRYFPEGKGPSALEQKYSK